VTNTPVQPPVPSADTHIGAPGITTALFVVTPFLILFGGFLHWVNLGKTFDWAIFQTMLGTALFWVGVAGFLTAVLLAGVRAMLQRQTDVLLRAGGDDRAV